MGRDVPQPAEAGAEMSALTGDRNLDTLVESAGKLVRAVRRDDSLMVDAMLADAEMAYGDPLTGARAMVVLLAAMVPADQPTAELLLWRANPRQRLRPAAVA